MIIILPNELVVEAIHSVVIEKFGGKEGILKPKAISSALARPMHHITYKDCDLNYICALLLQAIATGHMFVDGNKRTAVFTAMYTYTTNEVILDSSVNLNKLLEELVLAVVTEKLTISEISVRLEAMVDEHSLGIIGRAREKIDNFFS